MRRQALWLSFVSFLWAMLGCWVFAEDPAPNVLAKDSFEEGTDAPTGWSQGADIQGVTYVYAQDVASDGKRSLSLQKSEKRYFPIAQWSRSFKHGDAKSFLKVTAKVKAEKATKAIIDVQFLDAKDEMISHEWVSYIGQKKPTDKLANHDWKAYDGTIAIPKGTAQIIIAFQIYGPGKVWLDELEAVYVDKVATVGEESSKQPQLSGSAKSKTNDPVASTERVRSPAAAETRASDPDGSDVPAQQLHVGDDVNKRYFLIGPQKNKQPPADGYHLLVVMPGGDGSADFHPFVRRIFKNALPEGYIIAQPVAIQWTPEQQIVWPTTSLPVEKMKFGTEEFVEAMIEDVAKKHRLDRNRVYSLSWSSSGPAAYATSLTKNSSIKGSFVAMSVFVPTTLPGLTNAKGHAYYLYHSKEDRTCPYRMAEQAKAALTEHGAEVRLRTYPGGHGWSSGDIYQDIREGIDWLEQQR